ncbi:Heat-labile enterotoxin IIB, A chain precursor [Proteus vulgaris]|uniref:enterotoxin A family protein n=1 Tax=Proteus vulgaris TaxID=585 RepID=UPI000DF99BF3|nr:enterotoxin A family protein [Proteus vulgaris]SUC00076.1 Heat-labile enterotoxin IIB, A chain precursor [Proteus vulgaris]
MLKIFHVIIVALGIIIVPSVQSSLIDSPREPPEFTNEPSFPNISQLVYRAESLSPEEIRADGAIFARGVTPHYPFNLETRPAVDISLYNHARGVPNTGNANNNSGYVGTTTSRGYALQHLNEYLNHRGYIYYIAASSNFIDVNGTLGRHSPNPQELEYAAMNQIQYRQILGWRHVQSSNIGPFVHNLHYNGLAFNSPSTSGGIQYQLAAFGDISPEWGEFPWSEHAECEFRYACSPKQSSFHAAEEYLAKIRPIAKKKIVIVYCQIMVGGFGNLSMAGPDC